MAMRNVIRTRLVALALSGVVLAVAAVGVLASSTSHATVERQCVADPQGDVHTMQDAPADFPRADILEVCASYEQDALMFSMRVAEPTDPQADQTWGEGTTAAIWTIQAQARAYGGPSGQVLLESRDGELRVVATWYDDQTPVCSGSGSFDGTWYAASFDPACLDVPDTIAFSGYFQYDSNPAEAGDFASTYYDVAPEGMGREGEGRYSGPVTRADAAPGSQRLAGRFAGSTRIDTAVEISRSQFPRGAEEVYLARQDAFADALAAGVLTRGPILLVPQCGPLPQVVATEIARLDPVRVIALGGPAAVCDSLLAAARDA